MNGSLFSRRLVLSSAFPRPNVSFIPAHREFGMSSAPLKIPRRFAPLNKNGNEEIQEAPKLKGVVFDVDGTLW